MPQVFVEAHDVDHRLAQLGLEEERLAEVVFRGYVAFASCTPNDPPIFPGFYAWAAMVRGLREYLLPEWDRSDKNNYPLVINREKSVAIAVATGDEATGLQGVVDPTTKSPKGPSMVDAIETNQSQLSLALGFHDASSAPNTTTEEEHRKTWILLAHRAQGEVRCELSLPTAMGLDGRVTGWRERIILQAIPTDLDPISILPSAELPDISVDVKRRK
jgi:hypothetical protein